MIFKIENIVCKFWNPTKRLSASIIKNSKKTVYKLLMKCILSKHENCKFQKPKNTKWMIEQIKKILCVPIILRLLSDIITDCFFIHCWIQKDNELFWHSDLVRVKIQNDEWSFLINAVLLRIFFCFNVVYMVVIKFNYIL